VVHAGGEPGWTAGLRWRAGVTGGRRNRTFWIMIGLLALGLAAAATGAAGLGVAADRHPTQAQITAAGQREQAVLWERLSAGQIFPSSVSYLSMGPSETATRVGIAPQARCASAVDAAAAAVLKAAGCVTMLRATYADASGTALATIGIAVTGSPGAARTALRTLEVGTDGGLLPVNFPGTVANAFTVRAREAYTAPAAVGPYVFLYAAGYSDGRPTTLESADTPLGNLGVSVTINLADGIVSALTDTFLAPANPCADKDVRC
jgi:hypothetical protein